mgnify:CR=1 FL=1
MATKTRVTICVDGNEKAQKCMLVPDDWDLFVTAIKKKFKIAEDVELKVTTVTGGEIDDVDLIRDDERLLVTTEKEDEESDATVVAGAPPTVNPVVFSPLASSPDVYTPPSPSPSPMLPPSSPTQEIPPPSPISSTGTAAALAPPSRTPRGLETLVPSKTPRVQKHEIEEVKATPSPRPPPSTKIASDLPGPPRRLRDEDFFQDGDHLSGKMPNLTAEEEDKRSRGRSLIGNESDDEDYLRRSMAFHVIKAKKDKGEASSSTNDEQVFPVEESTEDDRVETHPNHHSVAKDNDENGKRKEGEEEEEDIPEDDGDGNEFDFSDFDMETIDDRRAAMVALRNNGNQLTREEIENAIGELDHLLSIMKKCKPPY